MLPEIKQVKAQSLTLPTDWQTVIFRNYGYVRASKIAEVLGCSEDTVHDEAARLSLIDLGYAEDFESRGFITVIRENWSLLPYSQIMTLLGIDEKRLDFILEKEDFLSVKLGNMKPECKEVKYAPLTPDELSATQEISKSIAELEKSTSYKPFDFLCDGPSKNSHTVSAGKRIVHGYLSPCGDAFVTDCSDTLPDELLARYASAGVNGIWFHGVLSALSPYKFCPELSLGYEERRKNLNKIIERCKKYGISVYLYMNEPRALPVGVSDEFEELIGWKSARTLCMEKREVCEYLYGAVRDLCESVKDLGGIFTITMSENPTHCNFVQGSECPLCKDIPAYVSAARVNNVMWQAMKDSGCRGELIANLWGWSSYMGWSEENICAGIDALSPEISVLCVSEYDLEIEKGGIKSKVIDYSISNPGPSDVTRDMLKRARENGHKIYAKIQASNSWECSAVPYVPVFDLVYEHLVNLAEVGVNDLFLTWTLGGYPSPSVEIAARFDDNFDLDEWYKEKFAADHVTVHNGITELCRAFREYPFSIKALYLSPKTLGSANLWDISPEEKGSTMVCYAYDDFDSWIYPYPLEIYVSQLEKLLDGWKLGIDILEAASRTPLLEEILRYARVALCHFNADLLQTLFSVYKRENDRAGMSGCLRKERENALVLLDNLRQDARVGYEASNHYFYTERALIEKIVRMEMLDRSLNH